MTTRSGAKYQPESSEPDSKMDPNQLAVAIQALNDKLDNITVRLGNLEENRANNDQLRNTPLRPLAQREVQNLNEDRNRVNRPHRDLIDQDERILRSVRIEAPSFVGRLDPKEYIDWEADMDHYFEWYDMSEERKIRFAKMRLLGQAKMYWSNVERMAMYGRHEPVRTWVEMKDRLREKYLPPSYHQRLLDQWQRLTQGNGPVSDYISKFEEYLMRCNVTEDSSVTLSRFRAGLRNDIQSELFMREVYSLEHAYQLAQDYERFHRSPVTRQPEPHKPSILGPRPSINQTPTGPKTSVNQASGRSPSLTLPTNKDDKGKGIIGETSRGINSKIQCFKCNGIGHIASQCPSRALHIGELDNENLEDSTEDEIYIADPELADTFEGYNTTPAEPELSLTPEERLGVVRCVLTHPKESEDWRRTSIFHTFIGQGDKVCKVIIDSGSCINAISPDALKRLGLTPTDHPSPYRVAWIDTSSIPIRHRCLVPIKFQSYQDEIWCDVMPMEVGSIILGRPWLFDQNATLHGRSNLCTFEDKGKQITIHPSPPRTTKKIEETIHKTQRQKKSLHIINVKEFERNLTNGSYVRFTSYFRKTLWHLMGTKLKFSNAYHPQTDGQTEVVNKSLEDLLRCLVGKHIRNWDLLLPRAEFAYNSSVNRSIGMSPFEVMHGYCPNKPIDLVPLPMHARISESASSFAQHIKDLHKEIVKRINVSNQIYKQLADSHKRAHDFDIGDYVMIRIRPERFPSGTVKKLQACGAGPFKILTKLGLNAYIVDLPSDYGFSSTFNVSDLIKYKESITIPSDPFEPNPIVESEPPPECPQPKVSRRHDRIERILDEQVVSTRSRGYQRYLVRWQGRPESEDTWITREELQRIDPDILEHYQSRSGLYSTESSSPQPGRIGADTVDHLQQRTLLWLD